MDSDLNLTETQILALKLAPNLTLTQTLTQTLILTRKKVKKKCAHENPSFSYYSL